MSIFQGVKGGPGVRLPDHMDLPCSDDAVVENFQELPEALLLTVCLAPTLRRLHPSSDYVIGSNTAIYWDLTDDVWDGSIAPDWFYVSGVAGMDRRGRRKRSYVMWQEHVPPLIVAEFISNSRGRERDRTEGKGKFWIYEQAIRAPYYAIFDAEAEPNTLEVFALIDGSYAPMEPDALGHYPIPELGVSLGLWEGEYLALAGPWARWYDDRGALIELTEEEIERERERADEEGRRADQEGLRADGEARRADEAEERADAATRLAVELAERLKALGLDITPP